MAVSPFEKTQSQPGQGEIHLKLLQPDIPSFEVLNFTYPLKLVTSTPHKLTDKHDPAKKDSSSHVEARSAIVPLIFLLSYGGGLLPPDSISLSITLDPFTCLTLTTQGSTKVFPSISSTITPISAQPGKPAIASQTLSATIANNAALLLAPDPVQPFARSHYVQKQMFSLAPTASLCLLDWVIEGRRARGECWQAGSWRGRNEIWREFESPDSAKDEKEKILMLRDAIILDDGPQGPGQSSLRKEGIGVFGTIIIAGPLFKKLGDFFLREFNALPRIGARKWDDEDDNLENLGEEERILHTWRAARVQQEGKGKVLWTVAGVRGSIVVKFTAKELEEAKRWIDAMWRYEGTIARDFGEGGFMCLR